jgi:hypothetical protein
MESYFTKVERGDYENISPVERLRDLLTEVSPFNGSEVDQYVDLISLAVEQGEAQGVPARKNLGKILDQIGPEDYVPTKIAGLLPNLL